MPATWTILDDRPEGGSRVRPSRKTRDKLTTVGRAWEHFGDMRSISVPIAVVLLATRDCDLAAAVAARSAGDQEGYAKEELVRRFIEREPTDLPSLMTTVLNRFSLRDGGARRDAADDLYNTALLHLERILQSGLVKCQGRRSSNGQLVEIEPAELLYLTIIGGNTLRGSETVLWNLCVDQASLVTAAWPPAGGAAPVKSKLPRAAMSATASLAAVNQALLEIGPGPEAKNLPAVIRKLGKHVPRKLFRRATVETFGKRKAGRPPSGTKSSN
jgi:hypothetical protein